MAFYKHTFSCKRSKVNFPIKQPESADNCHTLVKIFPPPEILRLFFIYSLGFVVWDSWLAFMLMFPSINFKCPSVLQKITVENSLCAELHGNFLAIFLRQVLSKQKHHFGLKNQGLSLILNSGLKLFDT